MKKLLIVAVVLAVVSTVVSFNNELAFWVDWSNGVKGSKGILWQYRLINVACVGASIWLYLKSSASINQYVRFLITAGAIKSSIILGFVWGLLVVAVVGAIALPVMLLEGVGGSCVLLAILYFVGKKSAKRAL